MGERPRAMRQKSGLMLLCVFLTCTINQMNCWADEPAATEQGPSGEPRAEESETRRNRQAVVDWFQKYDNIRSDAEMTGEERKLSQELTRALLPLSSAEEKEKVRELALKMLERYSTALTRMQQLPGLKETADLQSGYEKYFIDSKDLFESLAHRFSRDKEERHLAKHMLFALIAGKTELAKLDQSNKRLDAKLRAQFSINEHKSKSEN